MSPITRRFTCILAAAGLVAAIGCSSPKTLTTLPADELFKRGKEQFDHKKYTSAVESCQAIIYNFPGKSIVDTAQY
ncbi:MAG TPA: hypothetical protein VMS71_00690, partial [Candidatus Acidoferrum sp.]|nr:hypothetical protein [Candidatus Acidoferrum sp.]